MSFCAQHNKKHITNTECRNTVLMEKEDTELKLGTLAAELSEIHQECNIDGYGDEGAGYDYVKQVRLLIEAGWTPPEVNL